MSEKHVLGLSGGRDSAALAVFMRETYPDLALDYFFTDTGTELPLITSLLIWGTETLLSYLPLLILAGAAAVAAWFRYRAHPKVIETLDRLLLKSPWAGTLATCFYVSTMTRTLGSLLSGGVPLPSLFLL